MSKPVEERCEFAVLSNLKSGLYECVSPEYCEYKIDGGRPYLCCRYSYKDSEKLNKRIDRAFKEVRELAGLLKKARRVKPENTRNIIG